MQFYLNGYKTGDPLVADAHPSAARRPDGLPDEADVLIIGAGPAGLLLAAQLANFPDIDTVIVDRKDGPLEVGQADGLACRTMEILEAFGLADALANEGYAVHEVAFWRPDPTDPHRITRTGRICDVEDDLSEMPHLIVNQARLLDHLRGHLQRSARRSAPRYGLRATSIDVEDDVLLERPVTVTVEHLSAGQPTGETSTIRAKYVVGCDGARSGTRRAIGRQLVGDPMNRSWGVMDVLAVTDFPDIRIKCAIHSAHQGNILIIPREGGYLVRLYIELDNDRDRAMLESRSVTPDHLVKVANGILHPYTLDIKDIGWWTVYEIGQRLCDKFDDVPEADMATRLPRVFIAGDACHTHSAKAGQGMNVSMNDTWNLGWKLGTVLRGIAKPELLHTYSAERHEVAEELINFDRTFARMFSAPPNDPDGGQDGGIDPDEFERYFIQQGRFTAGVATRYPASAITSHNRFEHLAGGFPIGMRFHSAPVLRLADAKPMHLGHAARADGAWRVYIFNERVHPTAPGSQLDGLCRFLQSSQSPIARFTPPGADPDSVIDIRVIFQQGHRELAIDKMPPVLLPRKGKFELIDYEKMFCPDPKTDDIFDLRGVDRDTGCMVVVRPDQYVSQILPLHAHGALAEFFAEILIPAR